MEPLIHFLVPFVALTLGGVELAGALPLSLLALLPDLDAFFHIHRSMSHSLVILFLASTPFLTSFWILGMLSDGVLAFLALTCHPILDAFNGYTPLFWPLYTHSFHVLFEVKTHIMGSPSFSLKVKVLTRRTDFPRFESLDAPLLTGEALILSVILLTPVLLKALKPW